MKQEIIEYLSRIENCYKSNNLQEFITIYDEAISSKYLKSLSHDEKSETILNFLRILNDYIEINSSYELYYRKGTTHKLIGEFNEAINAFRIVLDGNHNVRHVYYNLGVCYSELNDFDNAIENFKNALELDPNNYWIYSHLGDIYVKLNIYINAMFNYNKSVEINPKFGWGYYDLGNLFVEIKNYDNAIFNYSKVLEIETNEDSFLRKISIERIVETKERKNNLDYQEISILVGEIKNILQTNDFQITHYTSLTTANALIVKNSKFRLSEATYLNDTSEGKSLYKFLDYQPNNDDVSGYSSSFINKPFIGSFVSDNLDDNLTLWRMYGKEKKEEANGCSLSLNGESFIQECFMVNDNASSKWAEEIKNEFKFYKVAYIGVDDCFVCGVEKDTLLMKKLNDLKRKMGSITITSNIIKRINEIAFLFKTSEYQHENEIRLVLSGDVFNKIVDDGFFPTRVYIELSSVVSSLQKITIGPKVRLPEEWAAAFYYSLKQINKNVSIKISRLPYK